MQNTVKPDTREELVNKLFLMRKVRFVTGSCIVFWGLILWFFGVTGFNPAQLFLVTFFAMFINQPYSFVVKRIKNLNRILRMHQILDVFLVTTGIYFLGGSDAYFAIIIYSLIIIFAGVMVSIKNAFFMAGLCSLSYLTLLKLEFSKILPREPIFNFYLNPPLNVIIPIFICTSLFLIAYVSSFLAKIIIAKSEQSRQAVEKLKLAESAMIQAEKLAIVGQFASGIIHEIKNPLAVILSGIEFLEKEISDRADIILAVNKIRQSAVHANEIIKDLLNFSRPSGQQLETVDLNIVIADNIKLLKDVIRPDSNAHLIKELSREPIIVRLNKNQFEQVLFNLVINAYEAMPAGGKIFLRAYSHDYDQKGFKTGFRDSSYFVVGEKIAILEIQDEGEGISKEVLERVFDPFFTTKQKKENAGLGLSICKKIIDAHNGEIEIRSRVGKGTIVVIRLPLFENKLKKEQETIIDRFF
jgi:signal transduction histidine kinase